MLDLRYNLASILQAEGRYEDAIQAYQECYAVDIKFRDVAERLDELFEKVGEGGGNNGGSEDYYYYEREEA